MDLSEALWLKLDDYQQRLWDWQIEQFGLPTVEQLALGIIEEYGEADCAESPEAFTDGISDTLIFSLQLCSLLGYSARDLLSGDVPRPRAASWGKLAHAALKYSQRIRGVDRPQLIQAMRAVLCQDWCRLHDIIEDGRFFEVADEVMRRRWRPGDDERDVAGVTP